jgi:hypothetical protein
MKEKIARRNLTMQQELEVEAKREMQLKEAELERQRQLEEGDAELERQRRKEEEDRERRRGRGEWTCGECFSQFDSVQAMEQHCRDAHDLHF